MFTCFSLTHINTSLFLDMSCAKAVPQAPEPKTEIFKSALGTYLLPFMNIAFLSNGHLGLGLKFNLLKRFFSYLSIPA